MSAEGGAETAKKTLENNKSDNSLALSSEFELQEAPPTGVKSRSISPGGASRPRPLQNSSSGGLEAAILDTFITFEASQGATTPIGVPAADLIVGGLGPPKAT